MDKLTAEQVFDAVSIGLQAIDVNGEIVQSNEAADAILRRTNEAIANRRLGSEEWDVIDVDGRSLKPNEFPASRALAEGVAHSGIIGVREGSAITWLTVQAIPAFRDGILRGVIVSFSDISPQIEAQLEQVRLEEVRHTILQTISHEIRTPIAIITGWAEIFSDGTLGPLTPDQAKALSRIKTSARRVNAQVSRVLITAKKVEFTVLDLLAVVRKVLTWDELWAWTRKLPGDVEITVNRSRPLVVTGDNDKINWAVFELINNAIKFSPPGDEVTIDIYKHNGEARIDVSDNGIGIAANLHEKVFEMYYQVDSGPRRAYEGNGVGLTIARELARSCGGDVLISSEPGKGSVFTLCLPINDD